MFPFDLNPGNFDSSLELQLPNIFTYKPTIHLLIFEETAEKYLKRLICYNSIDYLYIEKQILLSQYPNLIRKKISQETVKSVYPYLPWDLFFYDY